MVFQNLELKKVSGSVVYSGCGRTFAYVMRNSLKFINEIIPENYFLVAANYSRNTDRRKGLSVR